MKRSIKWLLTLVVLSFLGLLFILWHGLSQDPRELPSALAGKPLPAFSAPTLAGETHDQTAIQGPALLNVWATWCPTCQAEHEYLNTLQSRGIRIYGLDYKDDPEKARAWLQRLGSPYVFTWSDQSGQIGIDLGVYGAPETFLIDQQGRILLRHAGEMNEAVWQQKFAPIYDQLSSAGTSS